MDWWQFAGLLACSTVLSTLIKSLFDALAARRARKNSLEDRRMNNEEKKATLEEQFNQFRTDQKRENAEIRQRLAGMEATMHTVSRSTKALVYSSIFSEAFSYVKQGNITPEERLKLKARVSQYIDDYNDGEAFKDIMTEIDNLRTKPLFEKNADS